MNESTLIEAFRDTGDPEALRKLFAPYEREIFGFMYHRLNHIQDAEDTTQTVFIKAMHGLEQYEERHQFRAWLYQIARNESLMALRTRKRRPEFPAEPEVLSRTESENAPRPMEGLIQHEEQAQLQAAIRKLPEAEQEVVLLRLQSELSFKDIAAITDSPLNTVLGRMRNATRRLREFMGGER